LGKFNPMKQLLKLYCWLQGDGRKAAAFAALASALILATAYYFQYVVKLVPCELCYWGRKPHLLLIALGLVTLAMAKPKIRAFFLSLMILAALTGVGISGFHVGVEHKWWEGLATCGAPTEVTRTIEDVRALIFEKTVAACDTPAWVFLGLSMAGWNGVLFVMLTAWLVLALRRTLKPA
jgi:disulfide bond formation protein DsbB